MSENSVKKRVRHIRHKGRGSQVLIYLGKQLRFFINENDWKVLPMAAIIAALVGMVIRKRFFINMEGSLIGGFALTCVAIWNGCFNSIQAVCRERPIIKREHRSGMHVSAYVTAHMIYQFLLCVAQTGLSMYVLKIMDVKFPAKGFMTPFMIVDIGISMLLISYASDMLSLFLSSISHTTTGAMTVMPFVLIFQLVFSGGIIPLPEWSKSLSNYTISNYGIKALTAQSGYNELPMETGWNTLSGMRNSEIGGTFTLSQVLDLLDSPIAEQQRDKVILESYSIGEVLDFLEQMVDGLQLRDQAITHPVQLRTIIEWINNAEGFEKLREIPVLPALLTDEPVTVVTILNTLLSSEELNSLMEKEIGETITIGQLLDELRSSEFVNATTDENLNEPITAGMIFDFLKNNRFIQEHKDYSITLKAKVGDLIDLFGEEKVKEVVRQKTAAAARKPEYDRTVDNIADNWIMLGLFTILFAILSTLALELIDRDKR